MESASQQELLLLASLVAPETAAQAERSSVDLIAVLDRSGSMGVAKLQAVKDTTTFLVQQMSSQDRLGVVSFDDQVIVNFPLRPMNHENKKVVEAAISGISAGGGTNLSGGLFKGIDQLQQSAVAEQASETSETSEPHASPTDAGPSQHSGQSQRVRTVFLFTDGQATTGVTNNERLKQILSVMLQNAISPTIYCFGYGNNYSTDALDSISQAGQGSSCFIEDAEAIPGALASALGGLMSMSAQNVELTFTPEAGVSIKEIDTSFPTTMQSGSHIVTVGDLYAEERKDILVKLQIDALNEPRNEQEVVKLSLRCLNLGQGRMQQSDNTAVVGRPAQVPEGTAANLQVQEAVLRLSTAKAIRDAVAKADAHDFAGARNLLTDQLSQLQVSPHQSEVITALGQDVQQVLDGYRHSGLMPTSRNANLAMSRSHASQRRTWHSSTTPNAQTRTPYLTSAQIGMQTSATQSVRSGNTPAAAQSGGSTQPAHRLQLGSATQPAFSSAPPTQSAPWDSSIYGSGRRAARAALQRAPSNVSAAGTEVYEPVVANTSSGTAASGDRRPRSPVIYAELSSDDEYIDADDYIDDPWADVENHVEDLTTAADPLVAASPRNAPASFHFPGRLQTLPDTPSMNNMMPNAGRPQPGHPHTDNVSTNNVSPDNDPRQIAPTDPNSGQQNSVNNLAEALGSSARISNTFT